MEIIKSKLSALFKRKTKVLMLVDQPGWAFDIRAKNLARTLSSHFDFQIAYVSEEPNLNNFKFDLIYVFWWQEFYHLKYVTDPKRILKQITSHRWETSELYGKISAKEFADKYLADAGTLSAISTKLTNLVTPFRDVFYIPQGVDTEKFTNKNQEPNNNKLRVGWIGKASDKSKGLEDIIKPATEGRFELIIAGGDKTQDELVDLYNQMDVMCIASVAEGGPNPLLEAMSCGCYIVATDVGEVPSIVKSREEGLIIERSVGAFRSALEECQSNINSIRSSRDRRSQLIKETRSWKAVREANLAPLIYAEAKLFQNKNRT